MTYRELVYIVLDEIKAISNDSTITEEHVIFLSNHYRALLILQKIKEDNIWNINNQNYQTICLDVEQTPLIPGLGICSDTVLKSVQQIPETIADNTLQVFPGNYLANTNVSFVSMNRFKYVGFNNFMQNIIYATLGIDKHVYLKSQNPLFLHMNLIKVSGLFEDAQKAAEYSCDDNGEKVCDILDATFAIDSSLVSKLIQLLVQELSAAAWRQRDSVNNSSDDLANLVAYISKNAKSELAKQITQ